MFNKFRGTRTVIVDAEDKPAPFPFSQDPSKLTNDAIKFLEEKLEVVIDGKFKELETKITAGERASLKFEADLQRVPTAVTTEVGHLKELMLEKFKNSSEQTNSGFEQRDKALIAALQAAKEAVSENNKATSEAAKKSETTFNESIKALQSIFSVTQGATSERLTKLETQKSTSQNATGQFIAWVVAGVSVLTLVLTHFVPQTIPVAAH